MASIEVDRRIAEALDSQAHVMGLSIESYLELFVAPAPVVSALPLEESERLLTELLFSGPSLPPDFSRADIYDDHD
jgi:hypothetical protein